MFTEQCKFPTSTDTSFLEKLNSTLTNNKTFSKSKISKTTFAVLHYAGSVEYDVTRILEKNKNTLLQDIVSQFQSSKDPLLAALFREYDTIETSSTGTLRTSPSSSIYVSPVSLMKNSTTLGNSSISSINRPPPKIPSPKSMSTLTRLQTTTMRGKANTTVTSFKRELDSLITTLNETELHFVRCVKPNNTIKANQYDEDVVCNDFWKNSQWLIHFFFW